MDEQHIEVVVCVEMNSHGRRVALVRQQREPSSACMVKGMVESVNQIGQCEELQVGMYLSVCKRTGAGGDIR